MSDIPEGTSCEWCDNPAEFETDEYYLCEEHHDQHVDVYRSDD